MNQVFCRECGHHLTPGTPRVIYGEAYVCGDCDYYLQMGKYNPKKKVS